ncbi:MAG: JAB domain-containing protein, partial [Hymenobacteraceae bacterium]|nr:JAB domain-containing protein [Hymenobacteraceae bacterium]
KITCSTDIYNYIKPQLLDLPHEEFWVILLNRANVVMKKLQISSGGVAGTVADPKMIFKQAIEQLASAIVLVHNHPSGNLKPSTADITLTKKMKEAGLLLDLPILDHLIFTDSDYYSFADEGLL